MQIDRWDILSIIFWGSAAFVLGYIITCIARRKRQPLFTVRNAALLVFCCYGAALLYLTGLLELILYPEQMRVHSLLENFRWTPFRGHWFLPIMQNFFLFVPLGFLVPSVTPKLRWNLWKATLLGFGVSAAVELLQGLIGRVQEMDDIIANTCGAAAGFLLWAALFRRGWKTWQRVLVILLTVVLSYAGLRGVQYLCKL